jgi:FtsP/CotA-like multicopper oxidase with cupredoxin domain
MFNSTTNPSIPRPACVAAVLFVFVVCGHSGCGDSDEDLPTTHRVTGTVVAADGQPISGGLIEFRTTIGESLSATGRIQPDGSFSLTTMVGNGKLPGAVAGPHQVTVMPPLPDSDDVQPVAEPITLPDTFEVKPDDTNDFTVDLPVTQSER